MADIQQLPIYFKIYQLTKILYGIVRSFPKEYKYELGREILDHSWQCLDLVILANASFSKEKATKIALLSATFDQLKVRLRMAQEIGLFSERQLGHLQINYLKEIGGMIGGWLRWSKDSRQTKMAYE